MLLNMVDPTLSVCVETWWDCMYFGKKALVRMFEKYIHYIGCFVDNCFTTLNVCNQVQLLWLLLQVKHMYIVCLLLRTITLCVFQPSIYLLCVFDFHWNQIVCFSTIDLFTLRVWLSLESNCMFSHLEFDHFVCLSLKMVTLYVWKNCLCHFECLRLLMFTLCVWIMFECLRLPIQSLIIHILHVHQDYKSVHFFALFNSFHAIHTSVHVVVSVSISSILIPYMGAAMVSTSTRCKV